MVKYFIYYYAVFEVLRLFKECLPLLNRKFNVKNKIENKIEMINSIMLVLNKGIIPAVKNNMELNRNFDFMVIHNFFYINVG